MVDRHALRWHLQHNLLPRTVATDASLWICETAIEAVRAGDPERVIVADRTAGQIVADLHLEDFVQ